MAESKTFRAMRRHHQQLPHKECEAILEGAYRGFLSVNGEDGYPYTVPMNFLYKAGHIYLHSATEGHKMEAIARDSKACFTVIDEPVREENDWWFHVRSIVCFGHITIVDDPAGRIEHLRAFGAKYFPEGYDTEGDIERNGAHTALLDFSIDHCTGKRVKEN